MIKKTSFLFLLIVLIAWAAPGLSAGKGAQTSGLPAASGQIAAADKDLLELLPRSTVVVMALDIKRLLEIDAIAKAMQDPGFMKFNDELIKTSGIDPKRDFAYVGWGIPAAAIAARLSTPTSPVPLKDFAMVVGLASDKSRIQGLVKNKVPEDRQEAYHGVTVFDFIDEDKLAAAAPAVPAGAGTMTLWLAFLDDTHFVLGDDLGVRGVIDVYQKRAEALAHNSEMAAFIDRVDKSGVAWAAVSYPPEQVKMIADSNPLLRAIEGFKGMIMAIDDRDSTLVVDIRTIGGTTEQNAEFASNLNGLKSVGALYAAEQPALAELLNGVAVTSGEDYTRLSLTVSHETVGKLALLMEPKEGELGPDAVGEGKDWEALFKEAEDLGREGDFERAIGTGMAALMRAEQKLGPDHPDLVRVLDKMADLWCEFGLPGKAEPLWSRSLAIREKALGPDHPDLARSLNDLATYFEGLGKDSEAVTYYGRLLAIRERTLGPEDPEVVMLLDKLARLHYYQRLYAEAETFWKRSLAIREKALGPSHIDVAANLHALALLFQVQGKYAAAEPFWKRTLAVREKVLGPDHPDVATTLGLLAELYRATKREKEAAALEARATRIQSIKR